MRQRSEHRKRIKDAERRQLSSGQRPSIAQFWSQPHGVRLLLLKGDVVAKVASVVWDRGVTPSERRTSWITAFPAHAGTLLSRRRRGTQTVTIATWFSSAWTKVQETTGGTISTDVEQVAHIARSLGVETVAIHYDEYNGNVGLIEASEDGSIRWHTYLTPVLIEPNGERSHAELVADPTPAGLTRTLHSVGIDFDAHVVDKVEMRVVLTFYEATLP